MTDTTKNHDPTTLVPQLEYLKLNAIRNHHVDRARVAVEERLTHLEFLSDLVDLEATQKRERSNRALITASKMPTVKTMDGWDWKWNATHIRREQIMPLFELTILKDLVNLILLGKQGLGKTRIALALCHKACTMGIRALFTTAADMLNRLYASAADRTLEKALKAYTTPTLLVIDEVGCLPFSKEAGDLFFQVIAKRYERGSILLTCNRDFKKWNEIFADSVVAAAIIERLVHHSQIITLKGRSYRLKDKKELEEEMPSTPES